MYKKLTQTTLLALLLISGTLLATSCSIGAPRRLAAETIKEVESTLEILEKEFAILNAAPVPQIIKARQKEVNTNPARLIVFYERMCGAMLKSMDDPQYGEMEGVIRKHYPLLTPKVEEKENAIEDRLSTLVTLIDIIKSNETPTYADFEQEILTAKKVLEAEISMYKELLKLQK